MRAQAVAPHARQPGPKEEAVWQLPGEAGIGGGVAREEKTSGGGSCVEVAPEGGATNGFSLVPADCHSALPPRIAAQLPTTSVVTVR